MPDFFITEIVSGGQTGADRAALDIAIHLNIPHGGWCPHGRSAEDGTISPKYNLKEAPASTPDLKPDADTIYKIRTELNARDSDGTLIILKGDPIGGTLYTIEMLQKHKKPYLLINPANQHIIDEIVTWVKKNNIRKLNIAGPRASQEKDIYESTYAILQMILKHPLIITNDKAATNYQTPRSKL